MLAWRIAKASDNTAVTPPRTLGTTPIRDSHGVRVRAGAPGSDVCVISSVHVLRWASRPPMWCAIPAATSCLGTDYIEAATYASTHERTCHDSQRRRTRTGVRVAMSQSF